jgi:hypothetical protein
LTFRNDGKGRKTHLPSFPFCHPFISHHRMTHHDQKDDEPFR